LPPAAAQARASRCACELLPPRERPPKAPGNGDTVTSCCAQARFQDSVRGRGWNGAVNSKAKLQGIMRVRVEGLSKLSQYNGQLGTIEREVEGGRLRVVLDQDGKVLSLKRENLVEIQPGQEGHVASNRTGKHTATQQRFYDRGGVGDEQLMLVYNVCAPKGFQRRSTLERGMRDWFDNGEATTNKCVLCGPGGIGKSTLVYIVCVCIYIQAYYAYICTRSVTA